jgi:hypothetical protein
VLLENHQTRVSHKSWKNGILNAETIQHSIARSANIYYSSLLFGNVLEKKKRICIELVIYPCVAADSFI